MKPLLCPPGGCGSWAEGDPSTGREGEADDGAAEGERGGEVAMNGNELSSIDSDEILKLSKEVCNLLRQQDASLITAVMALTGIVSHYLNRSDDLDSIPLTKIDNVTEDLVNLAEKHGLTAAQFAAVMLSNVATIALLAVTDDLEDEVQSMMASKSGWNAG